MPAPDSPYKPPASSAPDRPLPGSARFGLPRPSPISATVLSLFVRGSGHVYAGSTLAGVAWAATPLATTLALALAERYGRGPLVLVWLASAVVAMLALHVAAMVDAFRTASRAIGPRGTLPFVMLAATVFLAGNIGTGLVARAFFVEAFKIPSGSMMPTLLIGDHIFVDKTRAGARGDVIVFPYPEHPEQDFVKRVIAAAGDRIEFADGHPIVNGARLPSCLLGKWSYTEDLLEHSGDLFAESVGGRTYLAFYDAASGGFAEHQGPWTVKPGELFVVGDNRNNAHDSRMWFGGRGGGVPAGTVRGVALDVWISMGETGVDWSRGGTSLDEPHLPKSAASLAPALARCLASLRGN